MKKKAPLKPLVKLINIHQAKSNLSSLIKAVVDENISVKICKNGEPLAELRRITEVKNPLLTNKSLSNIKFNESPLEGADEEDWPEEFR